MPDLFQIPLHRIATVDIDNLLRLEQRETRHLDYKRDLPPIRGQQVQSKSGKDPFVEFARDVSAFANYQGGDIVFGIGEDEWKKPTFIGIAKKDIDLDHIMNLVKGGIEPQISGIDFQSLDYPNGKSLLVMRIPKSVIGPHQIREGSRIFWSRHSTGKHAMDYQEIHSAFASNLDIVEKAREWRDKRLGLIDTIQPFGINGGSPRHALHLIPLSFKNPLAMPDLLKIAMNSTLLKPSSNFNISTNRYTADGYLYQLPADTNGLVPGYCQFFRNGQVESVFEVSVDYSSQPHKLRSKIEEAEICDAIERYFVAMRFSGCSLPVLASLAYQRLRGKILHCPDGFGIYGKPILENIVVLPELIITEWPSQEKLLEIAKHFMDCLWNASGEPKSPNYPWTYRTPQSFDEYQ